MTWIYIYIGIALCVTSWFIGYLWPIKESGFVSKLIGVVVAFGIGLLWPSLIFTVLIIAGSRNR